MMVFGICVAHKYLRPQLGATRQMRDLGCPDIERGPVDRFGRVYGVQWAKRHVFWYIPDRRLRVIVGVWLHENAIVHAEVLGI